MYVQRLGSCRSLMANADFINEHRDQGHPIPMKVGNLIRSQAVDIVSRRLPISDLSRFQT